MVPHPNTSSLPFRVVDHGEWLHCGFAVGRYTDCVSPGWSRGASELAATATAASAAATTGALGAAEVPIHDVYALRTGWVLNRAYDVARRVENLDFDVLSIGLKPVGKPCAEGRIRSVEPAFAVAVSTGLVAEPLHSGNGIKDVEVLSHQLGGCLLKRFDGSDPNAPSVGAENNLALSRVDHDVVYGNSRNSCCPLRPGLSAVDRYVETELGSYVKEVLIRRVFLDYVSSVVCRQVRADVCPCLPEVFGDVNVGLVVTRSVAVERRVSSLELEFAGFDPADPGVLGKS